MRIFKFIKCLIFVMCITPNSSQAQDFKIASNTPLPESSLHCNANVAASDEHGFLTTWTNYHLEGQTRYLRNYACRISKTGEMLDSAAIYLSNSTWHYYSPCAVFAGGNWVVIMQKDYMLEWIGAMRITPSGELLDNEPVNVVQSKGYATLGYPTLATNGTEILCAYGVGGDSLFVSLFDAELNIVAERIGIFPETGTGIHNYRALAHEGNFYITFRSSNLDSPGVKLVVLNPLGEILALKTVVRDFTIQHCYGVPAIFASGDTVCVSYFDASDLYIRRYNLDGSPIDTDPLNIYQYPDFKPVLEQNSSASKAFGYVDWINIHNTFSLFWPMSSASGMVMISFPPSFLNGQLSIVDSQCQIDAGHYTTIRSYSKIRAASLGDNVLTAWIDGREGAMRIYGNFFDINEYTGIVSENKWATANEFHLLPNYPNPFNPLTIIRYSLPRSSQVSLIVYNLIGKEITSLVNETQPVGQYEVQWNAGNLPSGVYVARLQAGDFTATRKLVLLK